MATRAYELGWALHEEEAADSEVSFENEGTLDEDDGAQIDFPTPDVDSEGGD